MHEKLKKDRLLFEGKINEVSKVRMKVDISTFPLNEFAKMIENFNRDFEGEYRIFDFTIQTIEVDKESYTVDDQINGPLSDVFFIHNVFMLEKNGERSIDDARQIVIEYFHLGDDLWLDEPPYGRHHGNKNLLQGSVLFEFVMLTGTDKVNMLNKLIAPGLWNGNFGDDTSGY